MKKNEFERRLLSHIGTLPKAEKDKVIDYYNELYYDKLDNGFSEEAIVESWGDPDDVAIKVLSESERTETVYYNEENETKFKEIVRNTKQKCGKAFKNKTFWTIYFSAFILTFPLTAALFSVFAALLAVAIALLIVALIVPFSLILAGIAGSIYSIYMIATAGTPGVVQLGAMLCMIAIGILSTYFTRLLFRGFKFMFRKRGKTHE